jgi:nucleoside-diphosphate-sugar epimerase
MGLAITGASSWLGQAMLAKLARSGLHPARLRVFASTSRSIAFGNGRLPLEALSEAAPLDRGPWLILHFAFLGRERRSDFPSAAAFAAANEAILQHMLRLATPASALRMVFASSGAAYGKGRAAPPSLRDDAYGACKVAHEKILSCWCAERSVPLVIPRIFNIGGPCVTKANSYALSAMILSARRSGAIRIASGNDVFRSYVHVDELLGLLCEAALTHGVGAPLCFDTAGIETVEMNDLAMQIVACLKQPSGIRIERAPCQSNTADWYVGDGLAYRSMVSSYSREVTLLPEIIHDTAAFLST